MFIYTTIQQHHHGPHKYRRLWPAAKAACTCNRDGHQIRRHITIYPWLERNVTVHKGRVVNHKRRRKFSSGWIHRGLSKELGIGSRRGGKEKGAQMSAFKKKLNLYFLKKDKTQIGFFPVPFLNYSCLTPAGRELHWGTRESSSSLKTNRNKT